MAQEPYVNLTLASANTGDRGLSRFNNLTVAALLVTDKGEDGINLITSPKELLEKYNPIPAYDPLVGYSAGKLVISNAKVYRALINNPGTNFNNANQWEYLPGHPTYAPLSEDLHTSFHHIYSILDEVAVLVVKYGATYSPVQSNSGNTNSLSGLFGTLPFVRYSGKVAISDKGNSYFIDSDNKLIDTYYLYSPGEISINSVQFINIQSQLSNLGAEIYAYYYTNDNQLTILVAYSSETVSTEDLNNALEVTNAPVSPNLTIATDYNFLLVLNNELGFTIDNTTTVTETLAITSVNTGLGIVGVDVSGVAETFQFDGGDITLDTNSSLTIIGNTTSGDINDIAIAGAVSFEDALVDVLNPPAPSGTTVTIGGMISAMNSLLDYDGGYRIDLIFDSGICNPAYHSTLNSLAKSLKSFAPYGIDEDEIGDMTAITSFVGLSSVADAQSYRLAPFNWTSFGDHVIKLSPITEYIRCISGNKNNQSEFAPVMGLNNGVVAFTNLTKEFTKSEREALLDLRINTIKRDKFRGRSYINKNVTCLPNDYLFNEEQIIRMANRIGWDCNYLLEQFLGELDIKDTALAIESILNAYYKNTFGNQLFKPEKFEVICSSENNTFGDGEMNVEVNIYVGRALTKINVLVKALPLSAMN